MSSDSVEMRIDASAGSLSAAISAVRGAVRARLASAWSALRARAAAVSYDSGSRAHRIGTSATEPFNDRYKISGQIAALATEISRTDYTCRPPKIGVPAGIAYRAVRLRRRA